MTDCLFFAVCFGLLFAAIAHRFHYMKSLTGVGNGGSVGASYWGTYGNGGQDTKRIALPTTDGLCPRCYTKNVAKGQCTEH